jgi:hypothetical protein
VPAFVNVLLSLLLLLAQFTLKLEMDGAWDFRFCFETMEQAQVRATQGTQNQVSLVVCTLPLVVIGSCFQKPMQTAAAGKLATLGAVLQRAAACVGNVHSSVCVQALLALITQT